MGDGGLAGLPKVLLLWWCSSLAPLRLQSKTVDPDREAKLLAECREKMREEFLEEQRVCLSLQEGAGGSESTLLPNSFPTTQRTTMQRQADRDRKAAMAANEAHQGWPTAASPASAPPLVTPSPPSVNPTPDQVRRMVMQHQRELTERTRREQELVLKLEQDHAAELERQRIVWQRKLEIAEESSRAVNDPESVRVISERQAKVGGDLEKGILLA